MHTLCYASWDFLSLPQTALSFPDIRTFILIWIFMTINLHLSACFSLQNHSFWLMIQENKQIKVDIYFKTNTVDSIKACHSNYLNILFTSWHTDKQKANNEDPQGF